MREMEKVTVVQMEKWDVPKALCVQRWREILAEVTRKAKGRKNIFITCMCWSFYHGLKGQRTRVPLKKDRRIRPLNHWVALGAKTCPHANFQGNYSFQRNLTILTYIFTFQNGNSDWNIKILILNSSVWKPSASHALFAVSGQHQASPNI